MGKLSKSLSSSMFNSLDKDTSQKSKKKKEKITPNKKFLNPDLSKIQDAPYMGARYSDEEFNETEAQGFVLGEDWNTEEIARLIKNSKTYNQPDIQVFHPEKTIAAAVFAIILILITLCCFLSLPEAFLEGPISYFRNITRGNTEDAIQVTDDISYSWDTENGRLIIEKTNSRNKTTQYVLSDGLTSLTEDYESAYSSIYQLIQLTKDLFIERRNYLITQIEQKTINPAYLSDSYYYELLNSKLADDIVQRSIEITLVNKNIELTDYQAISLLQAYTELTSSLITQIDLGDYIRWLGFEPEDKTTTWVELEKAEIKVVPWTGTCMPQYLVDEATTEATKYAKEQVPQSYKEKEYQEAFAKKYSEYTDKYGTSALDIYLTLSTVGGIGGSSTYTEVEVMKRTYLGMGNYQYDPVFMDTFNSIPESQSPYIKQTLDVDPKYKCNYETGYKAGEDNPFYDEYKNIYLEATGSLAGWSRKVTPIQEEEGIPLYYIANTYEISNYIYTIYKKVKNTQPTMSVELNTRNVSEFLYFMGLWTGAEDEEQPNIFAGAGQWADMSVVSPITTYKIRKSGSGTDIVWEERDYPNFIIPGELTEIYTASCGRVYFVFKQTDPQWGDFRIGSAENAIMYYVGCAKTATATVLTGYGLVTNPFYINYPDIMEFPDYISMRLNDVIDYYGVKTKKEAIIAHLLSGNAFCATTIWVDENGEDNPHTFPVVDIRLNNGEWEVYAANTCTDYGYTEEDNSVSWNFNGYSRLNTGWMKLDSLVEHLSTYSAFVFGIES